MSALFSSLACCFWWFLAGILLGWLLNRCLNKCSRNKSQQAATPTPQAASTPKPAATPAAATAAVPVPAAASVPDAPKAAPAAPKAALKAAPKTTKKPAPKAAPEAAAKAATAAIDLAAAKKAGFALKNANDLTVVEGIGPKINELLLNAGIKTFAQLATATVPQLRKILDDGGSRFRIANPSTWAQQSALAAENKWTELKKLQDKLSAGVKK